MKPEAFRDLDIQLFKGNGGYTAWLVCPDGKRVNNQFTLPLDEGNLKYYISEATRGPGEVKRGLTDRPTAFAEKLGRALFDAVFSGPLLAQLDANLDQCAGQNLRLRFDLQGAPELAALPWEYLYHSRRKFFLALSPDTALVRYLQVDEPAAPLLVRPPLRILAMACSPKDAPTLNLAKERAGLEQGLVRLINSKLATVDWLPENSLEALTEAVDNKAFENDPYHIFHFVGHGAYTDGSPDAQGILLFEDPDGRAVEVDSQHLSWALRRSVKLAVINACNSAQGQGVDASTGVASSLLQQGIPAVVAMQFEISDVVATKFAEEFYGRIALGLPVDLAMTHARRSLMAVFPGNAEWGTPVLFLRALSGRIFNVQPDEQVDQKVAIAQDAVAQALLKAQVDTANPSGAAAPTPTPAVFTNAAVSTNKIDTIEPRYQRACRLMREERWGEACAVFKEINQQRPGYKDIVKLWGQCNEEVKLGVLYERLISDRVEGNWPQVVQGSEEIMTRRPDYKDVRAFHAEARAMIAKPKDLPPPSPDDSSNAPTETTDTSHPYGRLVITRGTQHGRIVPLTEEVTEIGRALIDPSDPLISRRHAVLRRRKGEVWIDDISANGTKVNGVLMRGPRKLNPGDVVEMGGAALRFQLESGVGGSNKPLDLPN